MTRVPEPPFVPGNQVTLLRDGEETFPAMLEAIASARNTVHCEVFIFQDDAIGQQFAAAFREAARRGVTVRVSYDGAGSFATPESFWESMREAGVQVFGFRHIAPWRHGWGLMRRNHR